MATNNVTPLDPVARHRSEELRRKVFAGTLSKLTTEDWDAMMSRAETRVYRYNEVILRQDVVGEALFIVADGEVRVEREGTNRSAQLARLGPGSVFGEMSLLDQAGASASVIADGKVEVVYLDADGLLSLVRGDPGFASRFFQSLATTLSRRLRATNELILGRF